MSENAIKGIMDVTMEKVRAMVDADTVVGTPIYLPNEITVVPVSKISFGFATGGSDFPSKTQNGLFGGGGGAGVSVSPTAFIVIKGSEVKLLQISNKPSASDQVIAAVPELIDKISGMFKKDKTAETAAE